MRLKTSKPKPKMPKKFTPGLKNLEKMKTYCERRYFVKCTYNMAQKLDIFRELLEVAFNFLQSPLDFELKTRTFESNCY